MIIFFASFILIIFLINFFLKKNSVLLNDTGYNHQSFTSLKKVPLSGGILILYFFIYNFKSFDLNLLIYLTIFFLIGLFGDLNLIRSPSKRFFLQLIFIVILIVDFNLNIDDLKINLLNNLLNNYYFNIFFVSFCFLVLLNGTNFIDGNNCLSLGYFFLILFFLLRLIDEQIIMFEKRILYEFFLVLLVLLIFNFFNKIYLGDNGIYLITIFLGYLLIDIYIKNPNLSPYFIANLLWYPSFEIFFSIFRKFFYRKSPMSPDTHHLHQLFYSFLLRKVKFKAEILNSFTGLIINFYNFLIFFYAIKFSYASKTQLTCIFISICVYVFCYSILLKNKEALSKK